MNGTKFTCKYQYILARYHMDIYSKYAKFILLFNNRSYKTPIWYNGLIKDIKDRATASKTS